MNRIDPVQLTRQLIAFDTVNPPGHESPCAQFLAGILEDAGFEVALYGLDEDRANLVATRHGTRGGSSLVFTGHMDVVPLGTRAWQHDPFAGEVVDKRLYGRGSSDMKSGIAAFVCAAIEAERHGDTWDTALVITAGEETGCLGAASLVANHHLSPASAIIVGEPTNNAVYVGHKGALWLQLTTTGVTAHGSMPENGDNAIYKAAHMIDRLQCFSFHCAHHPVLGAPSLSVGTMHGGLNINSVPDRAEIGIDIRTIPEINHTELQKDLEQHLGEKIELKALIDLPGIWTSPSEPWVQRVAALVSEKTGASVAPRGATYFSDASLLTPALGYPATLVLGPGNPAQAHQTDEWCELMRIHQAVDIYRSILADWNAQPVA